MGFPLAAAADRIISSLATATGAPALERLEGTTLLCERAMLRGWSIPGRTSAGGGCRLFDARGDTLALNLSRGVDRELLPALFETHEFDVNDEEAIAACIARSDAAALVARGRSMGLAIAAESETPPVPAKPWAQIAPGCPAAAARRHAPRILDLSSLWAGPLASHLLWLAGAPVVKVESRSRPDAMRWGDESFYGLLNQAKASVVLDFADADDRRALLTLIAASDIVIEAARPRALAQLGIDAAEIVRTTPGLVWLTITGHGAEDEAGGWVGFGDDCGVAGGLSAALRAAGGRSGFVGDAIADPLTGMLAALVAWEGWSSRQGGRFALAMSHVAAHCLAEARSQDPAACRSSLEAWCADLGKPFPSVARRSVIPLPAFGEQTQSCLERARNWTLDPA